MDGKLRDDHAVILLHLMKPPESFIFSQMYWMESGWVCKTINSSIIVSILLFIHFISGFVADLSFNKTDTHKLVFSKLFLFIFN